MNAQEDKWQQGLAALNCEPNAEQLEKLQQYLTLLQRWNKVYNLTAVRNPDDMLPLHIFDSLSILPFINVERCLDVGSGAGLPGIPLAIMRPEQQITMLDTNGKKTRFIQQAIIELKLSNASVVQSRIESWQPEQRFDGITSRAFSSLKSFVETAADKLIPEGRFYAMKGQVPQQEIDELSEKFKVEAIHSLAVPELQAERHLVEISSQ
jgi:16S rRNA (guanine527-N7)-methyltransferase